VAPPQLNSGDREVLVEAGNILLNACLGMLGNLLRVLVAFSVPSLDLEPLNKLLGSLAAGGEGIRYALVIHTTFRLCDSAVKCYLAVVLNAASLDRLIEEAEKWETSQG
jgi:chemotaxis protein CheC